MLALVGLLALPGLARAAPISRPADLALTVSISGLTLRAGPYYSFVPGPVATGSALLEIDATAGSIRFAADVLSLTTPFIAIDDGTTSVNSVTMTTLGNLSATFSVGGAAGIAGEPPCPIGGAGACVGQTGFGGQMGATGTLNVHIVPHLVVIPVRMGAFRVGLGGPATATTAATADPAPWTIGTGLVQPGLGGIASTTLQGGAVGSTLTLVAPTYVTAVGNVLPVSATLEITFTDGLGLPGFVFETVPEPTVAALAIATVLVAATAHRSRRRAR